MSHDRGNIIKNLTLTYANLTLSRDNSMVSDGLIVTVGSGFS